MGDKNSIGEAVGVDIQIKTGHGQLKSIYSTAAGDRIYTIRCGTGAVAATGCVTFASAVAGDTVTVNGLLYTGLCGDEVTCGDFDIRVSDNATALAFTVAVNCDCRMPCCGTINTHDITACDTCAVVCLTSDVIGQLGNCIPLSTTAMCMTIVVAPTTGFFGCGDGDAIVTIDLSAATVGFLSMPYFNHPISAGIFVDYISGCTGSLALVFE